ncbi:MAG: FAD-dependent oxidoreductase [Mycoplasmataceae bacterium]|jgi:thioredoxin reductase (NADPH)|nr:FAD-dependent oxidoreductase [Mycoplasmataceae bacterium]
MALETLTASDANTFDILIIGAGPAGLTAAMYGRKANLKVGFIEQEIPGGKVVNIPDVTNYPGYKTIPGADLALNMYTQAIENGAIYIYGKVTGIIHKQDYHVAFLENGANYFTKALIIATGTTEIKLNVPGEDEYKNKGISYCALCDGLLTKNKTITVFGNNDLAFKDTLYLTDIANKIYLIIKEDKMIGNDNLINSIKNKKNIEIIYDATCVDVKGDGQKVTSINIKIKDKIQTFKMDYVFVFIGSHTEGGFLSNVSEIIDNNGVIQTDEYKQTKIPGIFAAGDVSKTMYRQISTAVGDGALAALAAIKYIKLK